MVTLSSPHSAGELQQTAAALHNSTKQIRGLLSSIVANTSNSDAADDQQVLDVWHQLGLYKTLNRHLQLLGEQQKRQLHSEAKSNVDQIQLRLLGEQYEADYLQQQISTLQSYEPTAYHTVREQMISVDEHAALQTQTDKQSDEHATEVARLQHELQQRQHLQQQYTALQHQYTALQTSLTESRQRQQQTEASVAKLYESALAVLPAVAQPSDTSLDGRVTQLPSPLYTLYNHAIMLRSVYQPQGFHVDIVNTDTSKSSAVAAPLADLVRPHPLAVRVTQQLTAEQQHIELTVSFLPTLNFVAAQYRLQGQSAHPEFDDLLANLYPLPGVDDTGRLSAIDLTHILAAPVSQPTQEQLNKYLQQHQLHSYQWLQYLCGLSNVLHVNASRSSELSAVRQSISISDVLQRIVQRYAIRTQLAIQLQALQQGQHLALFFVQSKRIAAPRNALQSFAPVAGSLQYIATFHDPAQAQHLVQAAIHVPSDYPLQLSHIGVTSASTSADALLAVNDALLAYRPSHADIEQAEAAGQSMSLVDQIIHLQQLLDKLAAATAGSVPASATGRDRQLLS